MRYSELCLNLPTHQNKQQEHTQQKCSLFLSSLNNLFLFNTFFSFSSHDKVSHSIAVQQSPAFHIQKPHFNFFLFLFIFNSTLDAFLPFATELTESWGFFISFYIMLHLIVSISTSAVSAFQNVRFLLLSLLGGKEWLKLYDNGKLFFFSLFQLFFMLYTRKKKNWKKVLFKRDTKPFQSSLCTAHYSCVSLR